MSRWRLVAGISAWLGTLWALSWRYMGTDDHPRHRATR